MGIETRPVVLGGCRFFNFFFFLFLKSQMKSTPCDERPREGRKKGEGEGRKEGEGEGKGDTRLDGANPFSSTSISSSTSFIVILIPSNATHQALGTTVLALRRRLDFGHYCAFHSEMAL